MRPRLIAVLAAALALPCTAAAQPGRPHVFSELASAEGVLAESGFRADSSVFRDATLLGRLEEETTSYVEVWLEAGREYLFAGACAEECGKLDLRLFRIASLDSALGEDTGNDTYPTFTVTPAESGPHLLGVTVGACRGEPCYYAVRVYRR